MRRVARHHGRPFSNSFARVSTSPSAPATLCAHGDDIAPVVSAFTARRLATPASLAALAISRFARASLLVLAARWSALRALPIRRSTAAGRLSSTQKALSRLPITPQISPHLPPHVGVIESKRL